MTNLVTLLGRDVINEVISSAIHTITDILPTQFE